MEREAGIQNVSEAAQTLGLGEKATKKEITEKYRGLLKTWHPDNCRADTEASNRMTRRIALAYKVLMTYIENYSYAFSEKDQPGTSDDDRNWWLNRFGDDPVWARKNQREE